MKKTLNSVYDIDCSPRVLIEANAGTGKTYTITGLFVRLLIENKLTVDRILVMTFTRKATAELRDRIFKQLRECLKILEVPGVEPSEPFLRLFKDHITDQAEAIQILKSAIRDFDESNVTTIHGFCQKVLKEEALTAGTPFELEVTQQDDAFVQAAEDYWRQFIHRNSDSEAGLYYTAKLLALASSPAKLKELIAPLISKSYADLKGEILHNPIEYLENILRVRSQMKQAWFDDEAVILDILTKCDVSRYQQHLESRLAKLREFLRDENYTIDMPGSLEYFTSEYLYNKDNLKKSGNPEAVQPHPFFELCQDYSTIISDISKIDTTLISESLSEISRIREKTLNDTYLVTYDDLLKNVLKVLKDQVRGYELSKALLRKYPFALVDEFQDTDPIQYEIFDRIYPKEGGGSGLFMIGDPKQAIYGFRGADIFTYFKARKTVHGQVYTLEKNFRSSPRLIEAVNAVFSYDKNAFIQPEIEYFKSHPGMPEIGTEFLIDGKPADHFRFTVKSGMEKNKDMCREFTFQHTVAEIANLIEMSNHGRITIRDRKLQGGDIAVLVSNHREADTIKKKLKLIGIDSVTYSRHQVFATFDAHRIALLMAAVLEPFNEVALNNVLLSGFLGLDLSEVHEYISSETKRQLLIEEFQQLNEIWNNHGFYPMFRSLLFRDNRLPILGRLSNSDRVLINIFQLADICTKAEREGGLSPVALYTWFLREKQNPGTDDERTLLLESDQNLVKISTIHNSKGLQFPVVFCPILWDFKTNNSKYIEYHTEGSYNLVIHIGQHADAGRGMALAKNKEETVAEEVRKAYVSITRAKYLCHVIWASHTQSAHSGMGAQTTGGRNLAGDTTDFSFEKIVEDLSKSHPDAIKVRILDEPVRRFGAVTSPYDDQGITFQPYNGRKEIAIRRKFESFSSLIQPHTHDAYRPDYDQIMESFISALEHDDTTQKELTIFQFPRGAAAGTAIHKLFERDEFDFTTTDTDSSDWISEVLKQHQIDSEWTPVMQQMLYDVTGAVLPGLDLSLINKTDQLREMEFLFSSASVQPERLFKIIRKEKHADSIDIPSATGFMAGFIDLIIRQNGRYYILDYKSNHLGNEYSSYEYENLKQEIISNGYDLQYHIYTLALIQYLKSRVADFDYESHFGGAAYLFLRGMRKGTSNGIWFHKPDYTILLQMAKELGVNI